MYTFCKFGIAPIKPQVVCSKSLRQQWLYRDTEASGHSVESKKQGSRNLAKNQKDSIIQISEKLHLKSSQRKDLEDDKENKI